MRASHWPRSRTAVTLYRVPWFLLLALVGLAACGQAPAERSAGSSSTGTHALTGRAEAAQKGGPRSAAVGQEHDAPATDVAAWLQAAREDPHPGGRLHALETWAQGPRDTLDPVTYALVDPDEAVRARAQELLDETLGHQ
jgi:hypothetical protein